MTPHVLFLATCLGIKCLMPRWCSTLVHSRGVRDILSYWYPLICTLLLLLDYVDSSTAAAADNNDDDSQQQQQQQADGTKATTASVMDKENSAPKAAQSTSSSSSSSRTTPESSRNKKRSLTKKNAFSPFPRTTPNKTTTTMTPNSSGSSSPRWKNPRSSSSSNNTPTSSSSYQQRPRRRRQSLATPLRILSQQQQQHQNHHQHLDKNQQQNQQPYAASTAQQLQLQQQQQQEPHDTLLRQAQQEEQQADWLRFWIVRGAVQACKVWLAWTCPVSLHAALFHVEVLFYLWIYIMPYLQPESIHSGGKYYTELPDGRPLQVLHDMYVQPAVQCWYMTISGAVPHDAWETWVVQTVRRVTGALVLVWIVSQETADWILHLVVEGRSLVVPAVTLFMPYFITAYGVSYVQFGLSMHKSAAAILEWQQEHDVTSLSSSSSSACQRVWLSYWVLHCAFVAILQRLNGLLWWIPFSTHAIFVLWCALSIPRHVDYLFDLACDELRAFSILPPSRRHRETKSLSSNLDNDDGNGTTTLDDDAAAAVAWQETKTAKCLQWIWERLPKANSNNDNADDYHHQQQRQDSSIHDDEPNNDDDDDVVMVAQDGQDVIDQKEELEDDDDYIPTCSSTTINQGSAAAEASSSSSSTLLSEDDATCARRQSARAVRQSRHNNR
jgi:hypothetical protein